MYTLENISKSFTCNCNNAELCTTYQASGREVGEGVV